MIIKKLFRIFFSVAVAFVLFEGCRGDSSDDNTGSVETIQADQMVIYEANPRVFASTNSINAISDRLDEIKALGTDVIWVMPIYEQGVLKSIGSPYCIKDFKSVNPIYGTLSDFQNLVSKAHAKGMKVMLDWIANHTSWDNVWISNKSWYTQNAHGDIVSPAGTNWTDVADLNYDNASMRTAMIDAMKYWVTAADVDGFRCDYADGVPDDFWSNCILTLKETKSGLTMLAEGTGNGLFDDGFDICFGWKYQDALQKLFGSGAASDLYSAIQTENKLAGAGKQWLRFTTNHDQASEQSPIAKYGGEKGAIAAYVITAFAGGSTLIYSSQEIGYDKALSFFKVNLMDWISNPSYLAEYKTIMKVYDETASYRTSAPKFYSCGNLVVMYYKNSQGKSLLVVVNPKNEKVNVKAPIERAGDKVVDAISGAFASVPSSFEMEPYGYNVYTGESKYML